MKTRKTKKKLNRKRTPELDATAKFIPESSKETQGAEALDLLPLEPLGADQHRD